MRDIKFRYIYKTENGLNHKVYYLKELFLNALASICDLHLQCELIAICQHTGLKDKNGKEIYEGDIVRFLDMGEKHRKSKVYYDGGALCIDVPEYNDYSCIAIGWAITNGDASDVEVIGNIYENPESLKGK